MQPITVSSVLLSALLAGTTSAHAVHRRAVTCTFSATPSDGDTCQSFADWWAISLAQLKAWNPTLSCPNGDSSIPIKEWCIEADTGPVTTTTTTTTSRGPTSTTTPPVTTTRPPVDPSWPTPVQENPAQDCNAWYKVVSGDTCQKVVDKYKISLSDFYKWNPDVGTNCGGLWLDTYMCVGTKSGGTPTTPGPVGPSPTQENVSKDCTTWYKVVSGDTCQKVVDKYKISLADFYKWNPDVGTNCGGLWLDTYMCVGTKSGGSPTTPAPSGGPSPTQTNVIKTCNNWYKVVEGDYCQKIVDKYKTFSLADFYKWNPDVGTSCGGLQLDVYVCVGVPGTPTSPQPPAPTVTGTTPPVPNQPGVSKGCNKWYYVQQGDYCQKIVDNFKITLANFYKWNTAIKNDCSNLPGSTYVCVSST